MIGAKRSKEHHYIPKAILKYFRANERQVWCADRTNTGHYAEPELRNIKSVFVKKDYYTVIENGVLSDKVEKEFYGKIDDFLGKFVQSTTYSFSLGEIPVVPPDGEELLASVIYHMVRRNPEFRPLHSDAELGRQYLSNMIEAVSHLKDYNRLCERYVAQSQDHLNLLHYGRSIRVRSQLIQNPEVEAELAKLKLRWVISKGNHSFILPSNLPYRIGNGGNNGLSNPDFEMWMPIGPKLAIALTRDIPRPIPLVYEIGRDHMRHINSYGADNSSSIASHDKKLLISLINRR